MTWRKDLTTYNSHPWIMFSLNWLVIIWRGWGVGERGGGGGGGRNWTIFLDVICVIYFIRYFSNPTEITRNHFRGVFLKNHNKLGEIFLRRLGDITENTSFWDMLEISLHKRKTSQKRHLFWDLCTKHSWIREIKVFIRE